ncbi:MAG: hypothetical protein AB7G28_21485 [Pirellulales bacterium]
MIRSRVLAISLLSVVVCCSIAQATITVVVNGGYTAWADDSIPVPKVVSYYSKVIPTDPARVPLDAIDGDTYSKNIIDWSIVGGQTILSFDSHLNRNGSLGTRAFFSVVNFEFVANETAPFEMSGYLSVTDVDPNKSGVVEHFASLYDYARPNYLFWSEHKSRNTHNEQLVLGEVGGDYVDALDGSLTGTLLAGHRYDLQFVSLIQTGSSDFPSDADSGASAVGNFTLKIGTVPEPSSVALCSLFAALGLIRRRQIA